MESQLLLPHPLLRATISASHLLSDLVSGPACPTLLPHRSYQTPTMNAKSTESHTRGIYPTGVFGDHDTPEPSLLQRITSNDDDNDDEGMITDDESDTGSNASFQSAVHHFDDEEEEDIDDGELNHLLSQMSEVQLAALESPVREFPETEVAIPTCDSPDTEIEDGADSTSSQASSIVPPIPNTPAKPRLVGEWVQTPQLVSQAAKPLQRTLDYGLKFIKAESGEQLLELAHSQAHQELFDRLEISWSVQWQIGVLLTTGFIKWPDVTQEKLERLVGKNVDAGPKVRAMFLRHAVKPCHPGLVPPQRNPWTELDKEDDPSNSLRMLGLEDDSRDSEKMGSWWGGIIEQRAVLVKVKPPPSLVQTSKHAAASYREYRIELRQQEIRSKSHRIARRFGSRRLIQLKLPDLTKAKDQDRAIIAKLLQKGFLLHGRIFRAFSGHDGSIHLIETNENFGRRSVANMGDSRRMSFVDFIQWFNPMSLNSRQLVCKWRARFALGLSTSVPALIFQERNIFYVRDIVSPSHDPASGKPESHHVMTDGCGRINRTALRAIQKHRSLPQTPIAVQARIAGAKGLWILDPTDTSDEPKIWITDSQVKIKYTAKHLEDDPSKRILDLLRVNHTKSGCQLSTQPVLNFSHNGIPNEVFIDLFQDGLKDQVDAFIQEWQQEDSHTLWATVFSKSGLSQIRKTRGERGSLRAHFGPSSDSQDSADSDIADSDTLLDPYAAVSGPDPYSGWASEPLGEQIVYLLEAGFLPRNCPVLARALKMMMKSEVMKMIKPCRIPIKKSAEAFVVPDFLGVLEAGEVYFRASQSCDLVDDTVSQDGILTGSIIIFRYPARTPSDCRLVTAVNRRELFCFTDVLVFSTKGERSGASILAGGDYDGDTVHMVSESRLVDCFTNADLSFADPPKDFYANTEQSLGDVDSYCDRLCEMSDVERCWELQATLVEGCTRSPLVGLYSVWTDLSAYMNGYDHPETHYLANMFSLELDSAKSGKHVIREVFEEDRKHYFSLPTPSCFEKPEPANAPASTSHLRPPHLPVFVLDALTPFAAEQEAYYKKLIDELPEEAAPDQDLLEPYRNAKVRAKRLADASQRGMDLELKAITDFVRKNRSDWGGTFTGANENSPHKRLYRSGSSLASIKAKSKDGETRFDHFPSSMKLASKREISRRFAEDLPIMPNMEHFSKEEAQYVMASYAYHLVSDSSQGYAFSVAFNQLALMKARAAGNRNVMTRAFHDRMVPRHGLFVR
ncbi:hypothetical protein FRB94_010185 [Tulasnella sp. JGI-2019a]|nr:hypothetical protein FRB93_009887 [Tulasnella sp. JGI-2019a]KAG8994068.1 hypothetical protein FRB94_010185 [Tulasnella sp. JGI-2019a]KAG9023704.1 hypothetical protein FRB95_012623 [Tulasnella sp. JGI-2019a]